MALHFGKRDNEPSRPLGSGGMATPRNTAYGQSQTSPSSSAPVVPQEAEVKPATSTTPTTTPEGGSKLTVGPNIKLKGVEITDCDTLVVEGTVEATMDSRVIQIAQQGAFKGSCEVDLAEIYGTIDGNLTVRQKLVIHATGRVTGRIRYGKIVIEEGGQLSGDVECAANGAAKASSSGTKPSMQLAA
ncbi:polymer-forming cytoskeletal protein [Hydrogenophaga sp. YM1]|jgi:cytoskeletal protein CcmA (bactofilin family)|uniref:bactofilin family protein n=1 Tax=Hydrogenophaga sp. YM1 TaxID=2806262 RepID=UPI0019573F90|nr:polymer-forming cytoskeletal protein [Hydrogenophaga sp. YM1]QRR32662.1 polymer-forming cytoskeletal protein [Hydrogenophaga sp. YM1]